MAAARPPALEEIEKDLQALDFDGVEANFRPILIAGTPRVAAYEEILARLEEALGSPSAQARLHALKGKALSNLSRYPEARAALDRSLALDQGQAGVRAWLGSVFLLEGRFREAVEELDDALLLDEGCAWAYFYRAAGRYGMGERAGAEEDLRRLRGRGGQGPAAVAARSFWALLLAQEGRYGAALKAMDPVLSACRRKAWPYILRANLHEGRGKRLAALSDVTAALKFERDRLKLYLLRAKLLGAERINDRAAADYWRALRLSSNSLEVRDLCFELARSLEEQGLFEQSERLLRATARKYHEDAELRFVLAQSLENRGRGAQAAAMFRQAGMLLRRAIAKDPDSPQLRLAQAQNLARAKKFAEAEAEAKRLSKIARDPTHLLFRQAHLTLAKILIDQGKNDSAQAVLSEALARDAGWHEAIVLRASVSLKMGRVNQCLELLERAGSASDAVTVRLEAGQILLGQGNLKLAEAAFKPLRARANDHFESLLFLAKLRMRQRRLKQARSAYEKAWAFRPERWEIGFPLAEILLRAGKVREMIRVLGRARKIASAQDGVLALVGRLRLALCLGCCGEAEKIGESILDKTSDFEDLDALYRPALISLDDFKGGRISARYKNMIKRAFERRIASSPKSPWSFYYYRQFGDKFAGGDSEWEAHAYCLERLMDFPVERYGWMRYHMGLDLLYEGDFKAAIEQFDMAIRYSNGRDWRSRCLVGEALLCQGDLPAALAAFDAARGEAAEKYAGYILSWKGEALLWAGKYREALEVLESALAGHIVPLANCWKGAALMKLGRHEQALAVLDLATATRGDQEALVWRSETLYRLGRFQEARAEADSVKGVSVIPNFYGHVVSGLARMALGDAGGMLREYQRVPAEVVAHVRGKIGIGADFSRTAAHKTLEAILERSGGVRRGNYERAVWMRETPVRS